MPAGSGSRTALSLRQGDWAKGIDERFDLVLCNPPYVAHRRSDSGPGSGNMSPKRHLFAGKDGLDAYRALRSATPAIDRAGGLAAVEIGFDQAEAVTAILGQDGLEMRRCRRPRRTAARGATLAARCENSLAAARFGHYIMGQDRARSTTKAEERIPFQPPTSSAV